MKHIHNYGRILLVLLFAATGAVAQDQEAFKDVVNLTHMGDLYDARGFRQGSAPLNVDGKLVVSTANGNVSYSYPVSERAIDGHNMRVELNYCGSVAFTSFRNYDFEADPGTWWSFNVNKPAWVIGVNGFAVQMLSSTSQLNEPYERIISEKNISSGGFNYARPKNWLASGYDFCNRMVDFTHALPKKVTPNGALVENSFPTDYIRLMRADGSVLELTKQAKEMYTTTMRMGGADTSAELYTGYYVVNEANAPGFAIVEYDTVERFGNTSYWYPYIWEQLLQIYHPKDTTASNIPIYYTKLRGLMPRIVHYFPGDGLEYMFHEWIIPYGMQALTGRNPGVAGNYFTLGGRWAGATIFYLEEIRSESKTIARFYRDRHSGRLANDSTRGRAPLVSMSTSEGTSPDHYFSIGPFGMSIEALGKRTEVKFTGFLPIAAREQDMGTIQQDGTLTLKERNDLSYSGIAMVKEIIDPAGRKTSFEYETFTRQFDDFGWPWRQEGNRPRVLDTSQRLYTITEEDKKVKYLISYSSPLDTIMTKSASNPAAIQPLDYPARFTNCQASMVEKYGFNGTTPVLLTTQKYQFQYKNIPGSAFPDYSQMQASTVTTEDKRNGNRIKVDYYVYDYLKIGEPAVIYTGTRHTRTTTEEHYEGSRATKTYTSYSSFGNTDFLQMPKAQATYVLAGSSNLRQFYKRFGYSVGTVRPFGGDTLLSNTYGKGITRDTVDLYRGDDTTRMRTRTITDYLNLLMIDTTITRRHSEWSFLESRRRRDSLRALGTYYAWDPEEWRISIDKKDSRTKLLMYDTTITRRFFLPSHFSLPVKSVSYDSAGTLLGGMIKQYQTTIGNSLCPRGSLLRDTVIGRKGLLLAGNQYVYEPDRNLVSVVRNPFDARALSYYSYEIPELKITGTTDQYDTACGMAMTDLNMHRKKRLASGEFLYWYQQPAATTSLVRYYSPTGDSIRTRRLTQLFERSYYGLASAVVDENGNYSKFDYDPIGRLRYAWLPYDIPSDTVRVAYFNGWRITPGDGISKSTYKYERAYCNGQNSFPYHFDSTFVYDTTRAVLKAWLPPSVGVGGSYGCDLSKGSYEYRSATLGTTHRAYVYLPMPKNCISVDSIYARFYVAAVRGACTEVKFSVPGTSLSKTYVFNCTSSGGSGNNNYFLADSVPVNVPLKIDLSSIQTHVMANGASFEIQVLTTGGVIWLENNSDDGRPEMYVKGNYRDPDWASDYTLHYQYAQGMSTVTVKVDDSLHSANVPFGLDTAMSDNFRYSKRRHFFEGDYFVKQTNTWLGNPDTSNTVLTQYFKNNGEGIPVAVSDELGYSVTSILDTAGRPVTTYSQDSSSVNYSYETGTPSAFGITDQDFYGVCTVTSRTDELGRVSKQYSDAYGRLRREIVDAGDSSIYLKLKTKYEYDVEGKLMSVINPEGDTTRYWYDSFGRVRYKQQPDMGTVSYSYDKTGKPRFVQTQKQADSALVSFYEYDDLGRLTVVGEATLQNMTGTVAGAVSGTDTLLLGRPTDYINPDVLNDGAVSTVPTVNKTLWMLPMQPVPKVWGGFSQWMENCSIYSPLYGSLFLSLDTVLRHAAIHYPFPPRVPVAATSIENLAIYPAHALSGVHYDTIPERLGSVWGGMPLYSEWAALTPHGSLRNLKGRKTAVAYRDHGGLPFHYMMYSYDERGRIEAILRYTENLGFDAVYYTYNSLNKVTSITAADALKKHTTWYSYDYNGRVDSVWTKLMTPGLGVSTPAYPGTQYLYNVPSSHGTTQADIAYSYTKRHQVDTLSYPPVSVKIGYRYSPRKLPVEIMAKRPQDTLTHIELSYNNAALIYEQFIWHSGQLDPVAFVYKYDGANRLTGWDWSDNELLAPPHFFARTEYSYDKAGNRTYMRERLYDTLGFYWINHPYTYGFNAGPNQLTRVTDSMAYTNYAYDPSGAMKERETVRQMSGSWNLGKERFGYSANGLLISYMSGKVTGAGDSVCWTETNVQLKNEWRYRYSPAGEREQKRMYSTPDSSYLWAPWSYYLLGGTGEQLAVYEGSEGKSDCDPSNNVSMKPLEYLSYGASGSALVVTNGNGLKEYRIVDHLDNVRLAITSSGTVTARYDYKPFGEQIKRYEDIGIKLPLKGFINKELDYESNLTDIGVRKFDQVAGRFTSPDKLHEKYPSLSPYTYAANCPLILVDRNGLEIDWGSDPAKAAEAQQKYDEALNYLAANGSPYALDLMRLRDGNEINAKLVLTTEISDKADQFDDDGNVNTIYWNPNLALDADNANLSPAEALGHEVDHKVQSCDASKSYHHDIANHSNGAKVTYMDPFHDMEEERVIRVKESDTARKLGHLKDPKKKYTRENHLGTPYRVGGVTEIERVEPE